MHGTLGKGGAIGERGKWGKVGFRFPTLFTAVFGVIGLFSHFQRFSESLFVSLVLFISIFLVSLRRKFALLDPLHLGPTGHLKKVRFVEMVRYESTQHSDARVFTIRLNTTSIKSQ